VTSDEWQVTSQSDQSATGEQEQSVKMSDERESREERQEATGRCSCSSLVTHYRLAAPYRSLLSSLARTLRCKRGWRLITRHRSLVTASDGQAQVEFVLSILFLLLLIFGIFELIMLLYTYNVVADSAKEGVRYAIVLGSDSTNGTTTSGSSSCSGSPTGVYGRVCNYAATCFHDISGMTVTVSYPDGGTSGNPVNAPTNRVQVTVSYPYRPLLNLGWPSVTINAAAEGRIAF